MGKARRKPSLCPLAGEDWGSDTPAARKGTTIERVPQDDDIPFMREDR